MTKEITNSDWKQGKRELKQLAKLMGKEFTEWQNGITLDCGKISFTIDRPDVFSCNQPGAIDFEDSTGAGRSEFLCGCGDVLTLARHYFAGILTAANIARLIESGAE